MFLQRGEDLSSMIFVVVVDYAKANREREGETKKKSKANKIENFVFVFVITSIIICSSNVVVWRITIKAKHKK